MKTRIILGGFGLLLLVAGGSWYFYRSGEPRRQAVQTLSVLNASLQSNDVEKLLQSIALPAALSDRTPAEQTEFLTKALRDEISAEGLDALRRKGQFGALSHLFADEASAWAEQAGVKPEDCVAFRMERNSIRAEAVLVREGETYRVVRCNNVKQMAAAKL